MAIQSLLFNRDHYTLAEVRRFLDRNQIYPIKPIHATNRYYRCRLLNPNYKRYYYRIGTISKGLDAIFEFNK